MQYELLDYQREAAVTTLARLQRAKSDWSTHASYSAFALSAVTGAGKTVIATAVIEAMIFGSPDLGVTADPKATFLWVTDSPALNEQTRRKMKDGSDIFTLQRLEKLSNNYLNSELLPGHVYFLNIQQLSRTSGFGRPSSNLRQHSGWDIIANTVRSQRADLYLVLDEAHRGMKQSNDRASIVQRLISGDETTGHPPAPVVWGISATIDRFTEAMKSHQAFRTSYPPVTVPIDSVRASGIVKDRIEIDQPAEGGTFSGTLLRAAIDSATEFERRWQEYSANESERTVVPVLVIQVADKCSEAELAAIVGVVEEQWPGLGSKAIVNVFGEHSDLMVGDRKITWVPPETIQEQESIRVVLAKEAISTGWDCPRAEVLYSERTAKDATHIAQIIGRIVRSPLARRITTDDSLNSVTCFLPRFNRAALAAVVDELTKPGEAGSAADVVINAQLFDRNESLEASVFEFVERLPSWPKPDPQASPLKRAMVLAKLLTDDSSGRALLPGAGENVRLELHRVLDGLAARFSDQLQLNIRDLETLSAETITVSVLDGRAIGVRQRELAAAASDLERDSWKILNGVREGVGKSYLQYLVRQNPGADIGDLRTRAAALFQIDGVIDELHREANRWCREQLDTFEPEVRTLSGPVRDAFARIRTQSSEQEVVGIDLPSAMKSPTLDGNTAESRPLNRFPGHLFADENGQYPAKLNDWEERVVRAEINRSRFVAWYRNPSRAGSAAHRIGYMKDNGEWGSLQVDFLLVSRMENGELAASIVDPHGDFLSDARAKLQGLARFAESFGGSFIRIESVCEINDGRLRVLDLLNPKVRERVTSFNGGHVEGLYESDLARDYR